MKRTGQAPRRRRLLLLGGIVAAIAVGILAGRSIVERAAAVSTLVNVVKLGGFEPGESWTLIDFSARPTPGVMFDDSIVNTGERSVRFDLFAGDINVAYGVDGTFVALDATGAKVLAFALRPTDQEIADSLAGTDVFPCTFEANLHSTGGGLSLYRPGSFQGLGVPVSLVPGEWAVVEIPLSMFSGSVDLALVDRVELGFKPGIGGGVFNVDDLALATSEEIMLEQIKANLLTRLQGVTVANGYKTNLGSQGTVSDKHPRVDQISTFPAAFVRPVGGDSSPRAMRTINRTHQLAVIMFTQTDADLENLIQDVTKAAEEDATLGGLTFCLTRPLVAQLDYYNEPEVVARGVFGAGALVSVQYVAKPGQI